MSEPANLLSRPGVPKMLGTPLDGSGGGGRRRPPAVYARFVVKITGNHFEVREHVRV